MGGEGGEGGEGEIGRLGLSGLALVGLVNSSFDYGLEIGGQFMTNLGQSCVSLLRQWSSGRIIAFQAIGRGSIPFWRIFCGSTLLYFFPCQKRGAGNPSIL